MLVTEDGMDIVANEVHSQNEPSPMLVTEDGMDIVANEVHP